MKITDDMVFRLNETLKEQGCVFKLEYIEDKNPGIKVVPISMRFLSSYILNPDEEFYALINAYFKKREIELCYNATRDVAWSKSGYSE